MGCSPSTHNTASGTHPYTPYATRAPSTKRLLLQDAEAQEAKQRQREEGGQPGQEDGEDGDEDDKEEGGPRLPRAVAAHG